MTATTTCASCGREVPAGMAFCGWCGARVDADRDAVDVVSQARVFGVPPATALLAAGIALGVAALVALVRGSWILGIVLLAAAMLLLRGFPSLARRRYETPAARRAVRSVDGARDRARAGAEAVRLRVASVRTARRLARELEQLAATRRENLLRLGEATYARDDEQVERLRRELELADRALEGKSRERERVLEETAERVGEVRASAAPTERFVTEERQEHR